MREGIEFHRAIEFETRKIKLIFPLGILVLKVIFIVKSYFHCIINLLIKDGNK